MMSNLGFAFMITNLGISASLETIPDDSAGSVIAGKHNLPARLLGYVPAPGHVALRVRNVHVFP